MTTLNLTAEQSPIVHSSVNVLLVQAFAGTGKTSTLIEYARANPHLRILYLAFSKAIQLEAAKRFPSNVVCKTTHALAWRRFGAAYKEAGKLGFVNARDLMQLFAIEAHEARRVLATVERFLQSADDSVQDAHVPSEIMNTAHRARAGQLAASAWARMKDRNDASLKMTHDGYFKLFQLSKPDLSLEFDVILGDEWQDTNPVTHALVSAQQCRKVFVGDSHQSIFAFRGAVNAMKQVKADQVLRLTQSFRFGAGIANVATSVLAGLKGEKYPLVGKGRNESSFTVDRSRPYTVIARSNGTLFAEVVALLGRVKFHLVGLEEDRDHNLSYAPFEKLVDVHYVLTHQSHLVRDAFIRAFKSPAQLKDYASATEDKELLMLAKIAEDYGRNVPALVARIKAEVLRDSHDAHVTLTTAHRSKGLEWDQVALCSDFEEFIGDNGRLRRATTQELVQEANLLYVATTRALRALEKNRQILEIERALAEAGFQLPKAQAAPQAPVSTPAAAVAAPVAPRAEGLAATMHSPEEAAQVSLAAQPPVQLAGALPKLPHDFHKRALLEQVQHAILVVGLLDLGELATLLARTREDAARVLGNLIAKGYISARLFAHEPAVIDAFNAAAAGATTTHQAASQPEAVFL